jgi:hypothetical protein
MTRQVQLLPNLRDVLATYTEAGSLLSAIFTHLTQQLISSPGKHVLRLAQHIVNLGLQSCCAVHVHVFVRDAPTKVDVKLTTVLNSRFNTCRVIQELAAQQLCSTARRGSSSGTSTAERQQQQQHIVAKKVSVCCATCDHHREHAMQCHVMGILLLALLVCCQAVQSAPCSAGKLQAYFTSISASVPQIRCTCLLMTLGIQM